MIISDFHALRIENSLFDRQIYAEAGTIPIGGIKINGAAQTVS
ncbi:hypothetical protein [Bacteroides stercorirosoris]|nr:hypothetical protein [Bacteroides stercorirosoris]